MTDILNLKFEDWDLFSIAPFSNTIHKTQIFVELDFMNTLSVAFFKLRDWQGKLKQNFFFSVAFQQPLKGAADYLYFDNAESIPNWHEEFLVYNVFEVKLLRADYLLWM